MLGKWARVVLMVYAAVVSVYIGATMALAKVKRREWHWHARGLFVAGSASARHDMPLEWCPACRWNGALRAA